MKEIRIIFCVLFCSLITLCSVLVGFRYNESDFFKTFVTVCIFLGVIVISYVILECCFENDEIKTRNKKMEILENIQKKLRFPKHSLQEIENTVKTGEDSNLISMTKKKDFNYELYRDVINSLAEV